MASESKRTRVLRFLYRSAYFLLYILLVALLLTTPADAIARSVRNHQRYNILILVLCYAITILIVIVVYALRLYVNKTFLDSLPKTWVPIEKTDLRTPVYEMIADGLSRSATIAYASRPRVPLPELAAIPTIEHDSVAHSTEPRNLRDTTELLPLSALPTLPSWRDIDHNGWASPTSPDLPNLQYEGVLSELPNLIEAKALTLAPAEDDETSSPRAGDGALLDPDAVGLLQRPPTMGLAAYIEYLAELDVLELDETTTEFLALYEYARFSTRAISNARFRRIMHLFASILRMMRPLDTGIVATLGSTSDVAGWTASISDAEHGAPFLLASDRPATPQSTASRSTGSGSVRRISQRQPADSPARSSMVQKLSDQGSSRNSVRTVSRRPYLASQASSTSLRSGSSQGSGGSVIRLATQNDPGSLPYVLNLNPTEES